MPPHRYLSRAGNGCPNQNENSQTDFYDHTIANSDPDSSNADADPNGDADPQTDTTPANQAAADQATRTTAAIGTDCIAVPIATVNPPGVNMPGNQYVKGSVYGDKKIPIVA